MCFLPPHSHTMIQASFVLIERDKCFGFTNRRPLANEFLLGDFWSENWLPKNICALRDDRWFSLIERWVEMLLMDVAIILKFSFSQFRHKAFINLSSSRLDSTRCCGNFQILSRTHESTPHESAVKCYFCDLCHRNVTCASSMISFNYTFCCDRLWRWSCNSFHSFQNVSWPDSWSRLLKAFRKS